METNINNYKKIISINYHLIQWCNFKCDYCIDIPNRDWFWKSSINDFNKFILFIDSLNNIKNQTHIDIQLIWWEPLLHKDIFYLIDWIFKIKNINNNKISIKIVTNWFLINKYNNELRKYSNLKIFSLDISYHFFEYKKYDKKNIFFDNIAFLEQNNIYYKVRFLLVNDKINFILNKNIIFNLLNLGIEKNNIVLDLIRKNWLIWYYNNEILSFFNDFVLDEPQKEHFIISNSENNSDLNINQLNNLKWYKCLPFWNNTFITINFELKAMFVWCRSLEKKYSLSEIIEKLSWKYENTFIYCINEFCDCTTAHKIKKIKSNNFDLINKYLLKISNYFVLEWLTYSNIDYLNNWVDINNIEISYIYNNKYNLKFFITEINNRDYLWKNNNVWIYYCLLDDFWYYVELDINRNIVSLILNRILVFINIFEKIILKWIK